MIMSVDIKSVYIRSRQPDDRYELVVGGLFAGANIHAYFKSVESLIRNAAQLPITSHWVVVDLTQPSLAAVESATPEP
jgi:hypothetical protein